jgi:hypothetical protein
MMVGDMEKHPSHSPLWLGVQFALTGVALLVAVRLLQGIPASELLHHPTLLFKDLFGN